MLHNGTPFLIYSVGSTQIFQILARGWSRQVGIVGGHNGWQDILSELTHYVAGRVVIRHHKQFTRFGDGFADTEVLASPPHHLAEVTSVDVGVQQMTLFEVVVPPAGAVPVRCHFLT